MSFLRVTLTAIFTFFATMIPASTDTGPRILAIGDSLMSFNTFAGRSIPQTVAKSLGEPVVSRAVPGARMLYPLPISGAMGFNIGKQYHGKNWDWVILSGGGNDLWLGCGCRRCSRKIGQLISEDGKRGQIPKLVSRIRRDGAHVIYIGYLRTPGVTSPIEHCSDEGRELEARISRLAELDTGITFLSLANLVPSGDRSYHGADLIHPSRKASREIGRMVAKIIQK